MTHGGKKKKKNREDMWLKFFFFGFPFNRDYQIPWDICYFFLILFLFLFIYTKTRMDNVMIENNTRKR